MSENQIFVSVIIPLYNVEEYLEETLKSVVEQAFENKEMILIDDCSTDRTYDIALAYAQKYENIIVRRQHSNQGVSAARNIGLDMAKGEYIMFVDSDDLLASNTLELLYNAAIQKDAEIVTGIHERFSSKGSAPHYFFIENPILAIQGYKNFMNCPEFFHNIFCWGKLYKKQLIKNLKFPEDIGYGEDQTFTIRALVKAKQIYTVPHTIYYYRNREGEAKSIVQTKKANEALEDSIKVGEIILSELYGLENKVQKQRLIDYYVPLLILRDVWTPLCKALLSVKKELRVSGLKIFIDWIDCVKDDLLKSYHQLFDLIFYRIEKMKSVFDEESFALCEKLFLNKDRIVQIKNS